MSIELTSEQRAWLEAAVSAGRFASVEAAVQAAVLGLMTDDDLAAHDDDPRLAALLDEARAADALGESISLAAFKARLSDRRARGA